MEAEEQKGKQDRATHEQLEFYVNFCIDHPELLTGKNNPNAPKQMQQLWTQLADGLNALRGPTRSSAKWKETLGVWKSHLRSRARKIKSSQRATGGGPAQKPFTDFEELALNTFGTAAVDGIGRKTFGLSLPPQSATCCNTSPYTSEDNSPPALLPAVSPTLEMQQIFEDVSEIEIPTPSNNAVELEIPTPSNNAVELQANLTNRRGKGPQLYDALWEKIQKREQDEKLRDEQTQKIIEVLQQLTSSVSDLAQEIKNLKNNKL